MASLTALSGNPLVLAGQYVSFPPTPAQLSPIALTAAPVLRNGGYIASAVTVPPAEEITGGGGAKTVESGHGAYIPVNWPRQAPAEDVFEEELIDLALLAVMLVESQYD